MQIKYLKILIAVGSITFSSQLLADFICPEITTCSISKDIKAAPQCEIFSANWFLNLYNADGTPQIAGKTISLHFTNAQSSEWGPNCNYAYSDATGHYRISLSSYDLYSPIYSLWNAWIKDPIYSYCYSGNLADYTPHYSDGCPFTRSLARK